MEVENDVVQKKMIGLWLYPVEVEAARRISGVETEAGACAAVIRRAIQADKERVARQIYAGIPGATMV